MKRERKERKIGEVVIPELAIVRLFEENVFVQGHESLAVILSLRLQRSRAHQVYGARIITSIPGRILPAAHAPPPFHATVGETLRTAK